MKFYEIDESTRDAIEDPASRIRLQLEIDFTGNGELFAIPEEDILEGDFLSRREKTGGVVNSGTVLLENACKRYSPELFGPYNPENGYYNGEIQEDGSGNLRPGCHVIVSFSAGEGNRFVPRFSLYVDAKGFRQELTKAGQDHVRIVLEDLSASLRRTGEEKDWTEEEVFTYTRIADKGNPGDSLLHLIAARGNIGPEDIDCASIDAEVPYLKASANVWDELSDCARAYDAHLETPVEEKLLFAHSPYQREEEEPEETPYTLGNANLFYLSRTDAREEFHNEIRLKWNKAETKPRQKLWRYEDPPVLYAEDLSPFYPFRAAGEKRAIENEEPEYTALYTALGDDGKPRTVLYADELDTQAQVESGMQTSGPGLEVAFYNPERYPDRAVIRLLCTADTDLEELSIWGRPIAVEPNFACYLRDEESIAAHGLRVLNATGKYFSDTLYDEKPQYSLWTERTLDRLSKFRRRYLAKTNRGIFHARVGAKVELSETKLSSGISVTCRIEELFLRYRKNESFVTRLGMVEDV
jgi:hypothetical protein